MALDESVESGPVKDEAQLLRQGVTDNSEKTFRSSKSMLISSNNADLCEDRES